MIYSNSESWFRDGKNLAITDGRASENRNNREMTDKGGFATMNEDQDAPAAIG